MGAAIGAAIGGLLGAVVGAVVGAGVRPYEESIEGIKRFKASGPPGNSTLTDYEALERMHGQANTAMAMGAAIGGVVGAVIGAKIGEPSVPTTPSAPPSS